MWGNIQGCGIWERFQPASRPAGECSGNQYPSVMIPFFHSESPGLVFSMAYQRGTLGPLRIPLGRLGAAASPTDKPRKYGALPPVIPKRHHYTLALWKGGGMFFETPKTLAHSARSLANPLRGKNYGARRKRASSQAKPPWIRYAHPLPGSVRPSTRYPHIFWR
jgi:hypothetical protein